MHSRCYRFGHPLESLFAVHEVGTGRLSSSTGDPTTNWVIDEFADLGGGVVDEEFSVRFVDVLADVAGHVDVVRISLLAGRPDGFSCDGCRAPGGGPVRTAATGAGRG